ncbi:MAG: RNA 2'-phosphotransferase [Candidatus Hydrothermales bacterium]
MQDRLLRLSKKLSYILRHDPLKFGINLDSEGFANIDELCEKAKINKDEIFELLKKGGKKRFEIKENKIRALYGHSFIKIEYEEVVPPEILYHGTSRKNLEKILKEGLKPIKRKYVHLSVNKEEALRVGKRHDKNPILLLILSKNAYNSKIKFFKAGDIYLCEYLPPEFIKIQNNFQLKG